jgi:hypothetical protein
MARLRQIALKNLRHIPTQATDFVFNAFVQIGFFAIVAAVFSRLVVRARAKYQYLFYIAVFAFCWRRL